VYVVAFASQQPARSDRSEKARGRPVVEQGRRRERRVAEFYLDGMTLTRPDPRPILTQSETLLIVLPHHRAQLFERDRKAMRLTSREQIGDGHPSRTIQLDPDARGLVS
jgi:hypothetical protein